jgi:hypothetical protein
MFPWFDGIVTTPVQTVGHAFHLPASSPPLTVWMQAVSASSDCVLRWSNLVRLELR